MVPGAQNSVSTVLSEQEVSWAGLGRAELHGWIYDNATLEVVL